MMKRRKPLTPSNSNSCDGDGGVDDNGGGDNEGKTYISENICAGGGDTHSLTKTIFLCFVCGKSDNHSASTLRRPREGTYGSYQEQVSRTNNKIVKTRLEEAIREKEVHVHEDCRVSLKHLSARCASLES